MEEKSWKIDFEKNKQSTRVRSRVSVSVRKKQNQEQIDYYKNLFLEALKKNNRREVDELLDRLLKARAEQTALALEELEDLYDGVHPAAIEAEFKKYYTDCYRLSSLAES